MHEGYKVEFSRIESPSYVIHELLTHYGFVEVKRENVSVQEPRTRAIFGDDGVFVVGLLPENQVEQMVIVGYRV
jgi:hypothetical protein